MIKIARWCCIYGFSLSLALAILNLLNGVIYDWYSIAFGLVISTGAYFYIERVVMPQMSRYQPKPAETSSSRVNENQDGVREENSDMSNPVSKPKKRRNRPTLKKK